MSRRETSALPRNDQAHGRTRKYSPALRERAAHARTLTRVVMQNPKLIRPPTDVTPAAAVAARGRPRALPDDLLREASARLGIMSLVAAGLWVVGTIMGRLAMPSMLGDESIG